MKPSTKPLTKVLIAVHTVCNPSKIPSMIDFPTLTSHVQPTLTASTIFSGNSLKKDTTLSTTLGNVTVKKLGSVSVKKVLKALVIVVHKFEKNVGTACVTKVIAELSALPNHVPILLPSEYQSKSFIGCHRLLNQVEIVLGNELIAVITVLGTLLNQVVKVDHRLGIVTVNRVFNDSEMVSQFCTIAIIPSVIRPTAKPINAPIPAPIGPPQAPINAPMPAPVRAAPLVIKIPLSQFKPSLIALQMPTKYIGKPTTIEPTAAPIIAPALVPPAAVIAEATELSLKALRIKEAMPFPSKAEPPTVSNAPPNTSPKLRASMPFSIMLLIPVHSITRPVIVAITPAVSVRGIDIPLVDIVLSRFK